VILDENTGNNAALHGETWAWVDTATNDLHVTAYPLESLDGSEAVQLCIRTSGAYDAAFKCLGSDPDRVYVGASPTVVVDLDAKGIAPGTPVYYSIHVNQGGKTTVSSGQGGTPGTPPPPTQATPVSPDVVQNTCAGATSTAVAGYTPKSTTGVDYYVGETKLNPGQFYGASNGTTVTVTARAQTGYTLSGTSTFPLVFTTPVCQTGGGGTPPGTGGTPPGGTPPVVTAPITGGTDTAVGGVKAGDGDGEAAETEVDDSEDVAVDSTKAGWGVLAATGAGSLTMALAIGFGLLMLGAALVAVPSRVVAVRGQHRRR
jgi:hypothetical protein